MPRAALASFIVLLLPASAALAEGQDAAAASALFDEGKAALDRGAYDDACPKLAESYRLDPAPGALFFAADCEEKRGRLATAWAKFRELDDTMAPDDGRRQEVKARLAALDPRVPRVTVSLSKESGELDGASIQRDGVELKAATFGTAVPTDPGSHVFTLHVPGRAATSKTVDVAEGANVQVELAPGAAPSKGRMIAGVTVAAVGVASMIAGAVLGGVAKSDYDASDPHCDDANRCDQQGVDIRDSARTLGDAGTAVFFVGAGALVVGSIVWLTAPKAEGGLVASEHVGLRVGLGGVTLFGRFQ